MIARFERVDPAAAADDITAEYVEVTVAEALEDLHTPGAGDFFGRIREERSLRHVLHRPPAHRGRAPRTGGGRLAGADRCAVLPRHPRRPVRPRPPPPVHDGRRRAHRLPRRTARRSRRRCGGFRHPRSRPGRDRRGAHRGDARDRRHDPGRAGRGDPCPAGADARRPRRPRHRQDRGGPAPCRVPAVRTPPPPRARRRPRRRPERRVPRLHRQRAAVARRAQRAPVHRPRPVRPEGGDHRHGRRRRAPGQGRGDDARSPCRCNDSPCDESA